MVGVGVAIPLTCAVATLQTSSVGKIAAINEILMSLLLLKPRVETGVLAARIAD